MDIGVVLVIAALPAALSWPTPTDIKRTPLDIRTSFDNIPHIYIPHHHRIPISLAPVLAPHSVARLHISQNGHLTMSSIPLQVPSDHHVLSIVHPATSNIDKISVDTNANTFVVTKDNIKIPVVKHTVSHSSAKIIHPPIAVLPFHQVLDPDPILVHDIAVIPVHEDHQRLLDMSTRKDAQQSEPIIEQFDDSDYSAPVGGFGTGLMYGGQGAGHGYFASSSFR